MKHCMIDLETLGTSSDSVFLSLAAVQFDPVTSDTGAICSANVSLESALAAGRTIDANTIRWWLEQKPEIMLRMFKDPEELQTVLKKLSDFAFNLELLMPWGNSARFDLGILEHAYLSKGLIYPWAFRNERDYRTMASYLITKEEKDPKPEDAHDPLADCYYQIKQLHKVYKKYNLQ